MADAARPLPSEAASIVCDGVSTPANRLLSRLSAAESITMPPDPDEAVRVAPNENVIINLVLGGEHLAPAWDWGDGQIGWRGCHLEAAVG